MFERPEEGCSSILGVPEIEHLINSIFGKDWHDNRGATAASNKLMRAVDELREKKRRFDVQQFERIYHEEHLEKLIYPCFALQQHMRHRLMGFRWWERVARKRVKKFTKDREAGDHSHADPVAELKDTINDTLLKEVR
jgi:hypothetical protein